MAAQIARGTVVVAIDDNPVARRDIVQCVERLGVDAATGCARPESKATAGFDAIRRAVDLTPGSALVDLSDLTCPGETCPAVIGNVVVYRDEHRNGQGTGGRLRRRGWAASLLLSPDGLSARARPWEPGWHAQCHGLPMTDPDCPTRMGVRLIAPVVALIR